MTKEELSQLSNEELQEKAKKLKSSSIWSALFIGFMFGIIIFSVVVNSYGFFTLIPLYFIYKIVKGRKNNDALKEVLKERGIKLGSLKMNLVTISLRVKSEARGISTCLPAGRSRSFRVPVVLDTLLFLRCITKQKHSN